MRTVSIFKKGKNQAIKLPKDMEFDGLNELEIVKEGNTIILRPMRSSWCSLLDCEKADDNFLNDRNEIISDDGRVRF